MSCSRDSWMAMDGIAPALRGVAMAIAGIAPALRGVAMAMLLASSLAAGADAQTVGAPAHVPSVPHESEAQAHFERATQLYARRELAAAIEAFTASYRLAPTANVAFNIAQTYELVERFEDAFVWYRICESHDDGEGARRAAERIASLLPRVAVLSLTLHPHDAVLAVDGIEQPADPRSPRQLAVSPGAHRVAARCAGCVPAETTVVARRGSVASATLRLLPQPGTLNVQTVPQGASVLLHPDMRMLGVTPLSVELPAGGARLTLRLDGHLDQQALAQLRPGAETLLSLRLASSDPRPAELAGGDGSSARTSARAQDSGASGLGALRWAGYGAAGALLAAGSVLGIMALDKHDEVQADPRRAGESELTRLNLAADLTLGAAVLTAVVTLVLDLSLGGSGRSGERE